MQIHLNTDRVNYYGQIAGITKAIAQPGQDVASIDRGMQVLESFQEAYEGKTEENSANFKPSSLLEEMKDVRKRAKPGEMQNYAQKMNMNMRLIFRNNANYLERLALQVQNKASEAGSTQPKGRAFAKEEVNYLQDLSFNTDMLSLNMEPRFSLDHSRDLMSNYLGTTEAAKKDPHFTKTIADIGTKDSEMRYPSKKIELSDEGLKTLISWSLKNSPEVYDINDPAQLKKLIQWGTANYGKSGEPDSAVQLRMKNFNSGMHEAVDIMSDAVTKYQSKIGGAKVDRNKLPNVSLFTLEG